LVSIAVIGVLIGLMMPGFAKINAHARRVVCSSNIRQMGMGISMYASDYHGALPVSSHLPVGTSAAASQPQEMMELRLDGVPASAGGEAWDGLGHLIRNDYLNAPKLFYCPSHRGNHPFSRYSDRFGEYRGGVVSNYHFRGIGPNGSRNLFMIEPTESALVADGMATRLDYNHRVGINVLRADQVVVWIDDPRQELANSLPADEGDSSDTGSSAAAVTQAWDTLDRKGSSNSSGDDSNGGKGG